MSASTVLLQVRDLRVEFRSRGRPPVPVIDGINLDVLEGETLGIVGESGCGKTTLGRCVTRLLTPARGQILFGGQDIASLNQKQLRPLRKEMQLVFQNPFTSLDPRMKVMDLVSEPLVTHLTLGPVQRHEYVARLLQEVGLSEDLRSRFPHQLSGGQAQRVALARALALNPRLIVLDEPTSALDVSVQAQIINLLLDLQRRHRLTYLFISHDLGLIQHISDRIAVMYLGEIVEIGPCEEVFAHPAHPYTQALLASTPIPDPTGKRKRLVLEGAVPGISKPPPGCRFHTRCPYVMEICRREAPPLFRPTPEHQATCHLLNPNHL
ncbi:MAG TPA: ABC transporter ATP-binding protein [Aggregatilineales bacterium]|nr:ABC transporter ATP-binding protein [Aggregatilineales bacterium]